LAAQDYSQQRPSQELVAKDLHGTEWKFRHIYRGTTAEQMHYGSYRLVFDD
jgi:auxin response factor